MLVYIENEVKNNPQVLRFIDKFKNIDVIYVDNYKNLFDKKIPNWNIEKSIIFAELKWNCLTQAPEDYGHEKFSYFLKNSLNCIFDCRYCFLKWAFQNDFQVYFVNYDDMKKEIVEALEKYILCYSELVLEWKIWNWKLQIPKKLRFYSSDYSDNLWMNWFSNFVQEFVPFFENLDEAMMEIRTKSTNIQPLLDLWFIPKNTEIAFSLNPQELIEKYEKWVASLDDRIQAVNTLLDKWFKVWLRFLPLLPVENYQQIYWDFINYVKQNVDMSKISSTFASWLLYTKADYLNILKKDPYFDIMYLLEENEDGFVREKKEIRDWFYNQFRQLDKKCMVCLDS